MNTQKMAAPDSGVESFERATMVTTTASRVEPQVAVRVCGPMSADWGTTVAVNRPAAVAVVDPTGWPSSTSWTVEPAAQPSPRTVVDSPGTSVEVLSVMTGGVVVVGFGFTTVGTALGANCRTAGIDATTVGTGAGARAGPDGGGVGDGVGFGAGATVEGGGVVEVGPGAGDEGGDEGVGDCCGGLGVLGDVVGTVGVWVGGAGVTGGVGRTNTRTLNVGVVAVPTEFSAST